MKFDKYKTLNRVKILAYSQKMTQFLMRFYGLYLFFLIYYQVRYREFSNKSLLVWGIYFSIYLFKIYAEHMRYEGVFHYVWTPKEYENIDYYLEGSLIALPLIDILAILSFIFDFKIWGMMIVMSFLVEIILLVCLSQVYQQDGFRKGMRDKRHKAFFFVACLQAVILILSMTNLFSYMRSMTISLAVSIFILLLCAILSLKNYLSDFLWRQILNPILVVYQIGVVVQFMMILRGHIKKEEMLLDGPIGLQVTMILMFFVLLVIGVVVTKFKKNLS